MSSPASRPDRPEGAAETRRGDDASEGHAAPSASSEGSNVAEGSSSAREGLPSAGTSTTGQDATGAEARDESPDVSSRVTSGAGKDAADAPHAPHAPSTVRPARPPQRPPSELRPRRGAASAPDARLAPPRASRGVAAVIEWRAKISQAARDVQTAVEDASGLRVDDSAADLESLVEEERKMVRDLPRNAGAALSDARRVAGTVAGATRRTVDEVVGTAVDAARAGNRAERGSRGEDPSDRGAMERRDDAARLRRKAERRAALANAASDVSERVAGALQTGSERCQGAAAGVASTAARTERFGRSAAEVAGAAARAATARFGECADAGKALLEETRRKRETKASPAGPLKRKNAPERTERVLRDRERKEKEKEKEKEKASRLRETFAETAERDRKRREEKMARVAEREAARRATLETLRARESVSRREKAALAARALAEREARKEAERLAREADRRAAKEAREAEKRAELLEKESARLASMRPERRARRERARAREAERDERVRAARAARAAERARLAAKAEAERRRGDSADEKASRLETRSIAKRRSSPFALAFASGVRSKSTKERTATNKAHSRDAPDVPCVDSQHPNMLGDALGGLLTAAGVAASAGVARVVFARADAFGAAERAKAKTAKALRLEALGRLAARAGADVRADFRDATVASVTVARARDAVAGPTSGPYRVSASAVAAETHACRRIGAPARVGPPLRLDAAWRALRRRLDSRRPIDGGDAGGDTGGDAAEEPPSPATAAAAALSPVEEAVRAAEAAAATTPAVAKYRAYRDGEEKDAEERQVSRASETKPRTNPESDDVAATPAERRDASAAGVTLVTPEVTPASTPARTPAGTPRRPAEKIDLDAVGKAADLAVLEALTPRGTPFGTPAGTPGRSRDSGTNARVFTLEEYARAVTKLEGKKEALVAALARLERRGSGVASDLEAAQDMESARATVSAGLSPRRGAYYGTDDQGDQGDRSSARRDSVDAVAAARLVTNGLDAFEGTAKRVESDDESDDEADDGFLQPETREARRAVARLYRECAALETKLRAREDIAEAEHSALSRRERETKLAYARKAIRHLSSSLRRRALLAWVLYLDEATRRRRLLRRAATKMRLRLASAAFESWLEYARMRRESRAERRLRELQKRAEQAEALEMEARRAKAAAAAKAAETASLVADAEAREARARREVEAMRSRGKASGKASGSASSDSES